MNREEQEKHIIYEVLVGSHLYGLSDEASDEDIRGIAIPPKISLLSWFYSFEQLEGPGDRTIYNILKAFKLFADANPNMLDILFAPPQFWRKTSSYWEKIYNNRYLFLSTRVRYSFSGYAFAQLKRMKRHRDWLLNPPTEPKREDFGLPPNPIIPIDLRKALACLPEDYVNKDIRGQAIKELDYHRAVTEWAHYSDWVKSRNPKRFEIESKCGYDAKNATHLVRLMNMAREVLLTGEVNVVRMNDREELLAVKKGEPSYEQLMAWAEQKDNELEELYRSNKSSLPHSPDIQKVADLCQEIVESYWWGKEREK